MSLIVSILSRFQRNAAVRVEKNATVILEKARLVRSAILFGTACYCTGTLAEYYIMSWGIASGPSMFPTMPTYDHRIWTDARKRQGKGLELGDCINFYSPIFDSSLAGKRVIGMPGDYVVRDPDNAPSVGGATVPGITDWRSDEEIAKGIELRDRTEPEMVEVPEGHVWVAGDNFSASRDSRFYGPVPMALIRGKTVAISTNWFNLKKLDSQMTRIPKDDEEAYLRGELDEEPEET
jgi:inner membrane protease subunit 1